MPNAAFGFRKQLPAGTRRGGFGVAPGTRSTTRFAPPKPAAQWLAPFRSDHATTLRRSDPITPPHVQWLAPFRSRLR